MDKKELKEMLEKVLASLTEEQKEKVMACKTVEELSAILAESRIELPDEVLDAVAGGYDLNNQDRVTPKISVCAVQP